MSNEAKRLLERLGLDDPGGADFISMLSAIVDRIERLERAHYGPGAPDAVSSLRLPAA